VMFAVSLSLLANAFPDPRERAGALAAYGASIGGAFAIGPLVGGALTSALDWQWIFLINIPIGLAAIAITRKYVVESRDPKSRRIDVTGQMLLTGGLFLLVLALLRGNEDGWTSPLILGELAAAIALLVGFVRWELETREPMLPIGLFKNGSFTGAQVAAFAISSSFFAMFLYITLYVQQVLGLTAIEAGLVYLPATVIMFVVSGATAQLGERVSPRMMIGVGLALVGVGMGQMMLTVDVDSSWTVALPGTIIAMIGTGLFNPAVTNVALGSVPMQQSGLAAGVNDTFRQAGIALGVAFLGAMVPAEHAFGGNPAEYVDGFKVALAASAAICFVGAAASVALIRGQFAGETSGMAPLPEPSAA
jgi:EmrB/QacA subfamily drug resistance transporter